MDARTFLGMEPVGDKLHWQMRVEPHLTTPGNFLFGGCGLGGAFGALGAGGRRPTGCAMRRLGCAILDVQSVSCIWRRGVGSSRCVSLAGMSITPYWVGRGPKLWS